MSIVKDGQKIGQKIGQGAVKWSWLFILECSFVSKDTPKLFLGIYLIHKRRNVKLKLYLELS